MNKIITTTLILGAVGAAIYLKPTASLPVSGVLNPNVTQENIGSTVCVAGWTNTIRPPTSYTNKLKLKQLQALTGLPPTQDVYIENFEEDHFVSLSLGGHPTDPNNLWPQPYPEARDKDYAEGFLHRELCAGRITLKEAQNQVKYHWKEIYQKHVVSTSFGGLTDIAPDEDDE